MELTIGNAVGWMQLDASGGFSMGDGFEPTVIAAAITPDAACDEIADWRADALSRWGLANKLTELHGKELFADKVNEVCRMLSGRGDLRLSAVVTDSQLLCSPAAVERHRARQRARAIEARALTSECTRRQAAVLALLDDTKFRGAAYGPKACQGQRVSREKLETAVLHQLTGVYRDGPLIQDALAAAASNASPASPPASTTSVPTKPS